MSVSAAHKSQDREGLGMTFLRPVPVICAALVAKTILTFREAAPGDPRILRAWFCPGYTPVEIEPEVAAPIAPADEALVVQLEQAPVLQRDACWGRRSNRRGSHRAAGEDREFAAAELSFCSFRSSTCWRRRIRT